MSYFFRYMSVLLALTIVLITGCGQSNVTSPAANDNSSNNSGAGSAETASKTVKHAEGTTKIEGTPKRIVALEWVYAEDLLALGVQPAGVADIAGYNKNLNISPKLDASVIDVGTRQEPSLEKIASLKPDLIISASFRHKAIYDKLSSIAPTLLFDSYPPENGPDQFKEMETTLMTIADTLNKKEQGQAVLKKMNDAFAAAADKLKTAGMAGAEFTLVQAYSSKDIPTLRIFTENSMASQVLTKIGLKNAHHSAKFEVYGYSTATIESLPALQKSHFLYIVQDNDNIFANQLKDNPVWQGLDFVKANRLYPLGGSTWLFGGPLSAELLVQQVLKTLVK